MDRIYIDEETGESISVPVSEYEILRYNIVAVNNVETGEPEINVVGTQTARSRRIHFQIPKEVKETFSVKNESLKKKENLIDLEHVPVGTCFGQIRPICLLLLAIVSFRWFLPVVAFLEVTLHIWAHHKNKALINASVYFRSPFHAISSLFCGICQNRTCMDRVGKIQQARLHKFLQQCHYMKRIVT